jgi:hypothetical protein
VAVGTEAEAKAAEAWVEAEREAVARAVKEAEEREAAAMEVAEAQEAATTEVAEALEAAAMEARMEAARSVAGGGECAADVGHFGGGWQERTAERRIKFIWSESHGRFVQPSRTRVQYQVVQLKENSEPNTNTSDDGAR